ncbi:BldC family transcriptional regulator [Trueperella bialowiezensis]|uniref:DNA binding domain, excisionase family n=1 Tax=Trueperella bialowiezensis TaxID=312285 RepID=A0A3S5EW39_9ACTO|nr:BldC family transcriptional regulator [Trueperella bialowiezensis]VEI13581.1 DNA binding domain, excisionase family [Trueperella bialowiezensis]
MEKQSELMTPAEVAELFRVDPKTVSRWADNGKLPYVRTLGGHRRFPRKDVMDAIRSSRVPKAE